MKIWNGVNLDYWAQTQTLCPKQIISCQPAWYTGYDQININWSDMIQEIPLEVRFSNFKSRLDRCLSKHLALA